MGLLIGMLAGLLWMGTSIRDRGDLLDREQVEEGGNHDLMVSGRDDLEEATPHPISHPPVADIQYNGVFWDDLRRRLGEADTENAVLDVLANAFDALSAWPPEIAVRELKAFLDTGLDTRTGLPFRAGGTSILRTASSLRVAALDWLGAISPEDAKDYARTIFSTSNQPDEWAISLRNYGRQTIPAADPYFAGVIRSYVTRSEWQAAPTGGYAEGFDALVYNRQVDLLPELSGLLAADRGLDRVAAMALDQLVRQDRAQTIPALFEERHRLDDHPRLRASLLARADPRDPAQADAIAEYLLDPGITEEEKSVFAAYFPLFSGFMGHRLVSRDQVYSMEEQLEMDQRALELIRTWREDPRFSGVWTALDARGAHLDMILRHAAQADMDVGDE